MEQDLLILVTIHEEQNLNQAAEQLYITQPALSYRINQIEQKMGTKIIFRDGKKLRFTPEGEHIVRFAKKTLFDLRELKTFIQEMKKNLQGTLEIGVSSNFALYKLPPMIKNFHDLYPQIKINVDSGWSAEIMQMLERNEIKVGIITGDYSWNEAEHLIHEDPITIISKDPVTLDTLPETPRIDYNPKNTFKANRELVNPITKLIENWWQEMFDKAPSISMKMDKVESCKAMVKKGLGYSIIPYSSLTEEDPFYTRHLTLKNEQVVTRQTRMLYKTSSLQFSAVNSFVDYVQTLYRNQ